MKELLYLPDYRFNPNYEERDKDVISLGNDPDKCRRCGESDNHVSWYNADKFGDGRGYYHSLCHFREMHLDDNLSEILDEAIEFGLIMKQKFDIDITADTYLLLRILEALHWKE